MTRPIAITASQVIDLLKAKHSEDVFVTECKNGPTWRGEHLRLDAWVMARSWSKPQVVGYEVKVSRGDFLKDSKWQAYLPYCNEFCFVCPAGLIDPRELPAEVGLLWTSTNAARLYTKKKAIWRDVQIPESLYRYVLMSRSKITREVDFGDRRERWSEWLRQKAEDRKLGVSVSRGIRETVSAKISKVEAENRALRRQNEALESVRETLARLGISETEIHWNPRLLEKRVAALRAAVPDELVGELEATRKRINSVLEVIERLNQELLEATA